MKKHIAFKIMLPLIVIFILTVTVNVSTTSQFQSFREVCEGMSNTTTEVPQEIRDTAGSMAEGITAGLSRNGVISSLQLAMVIVTIIVTYVSVVKPLQKTQKQLNDMIEKLEKNEGNLEERIETKKEDEIGRLIFGINMFLDKLQVIMKRIEDHSISLDGASGNIIKKVESSAESAGELSEETAKLCNEIDAISDAVEMITGDMKQLEAGSSEIEKASADGKEYTVHMKERANEIQALAGNSKNASKEITSSLEKDLRTSVESSKSVNVIKTLTIKKGISHNFIDAVYIAFHSITGDMKMGWIKWIYIAIQSMIGEGHEATKLKKSIFDLFRRIRSLHCLFAPVL